MPSLAIGLSKCGVRASTSTLVVDKAFCFDIDGVLLRGYNQLPRARETLLKLTHANVPFLLVTNGGGDPEHKKALQLSKVLGIRIHPEQLIISSTPLKPVCANLADQRVLVLGCRDVLGVARSYGLKKAITSSMLQADDPRRYPFHAIQHAPLDPALYGPPHEPFGAVMVLHDPTDYADAQLALDVLQGGYPLGQGPSQVVDPGSGAGAISAAQGQAKQVVPYYISNNDLLFAGTYPVPRLAGGAFTVTLRALWTDVTGTELSVTAYGKPSLYTSAFAQKQLARWAMISQQLNYKSWAEVKGGSDSDLTLETWLTRSREFTHVLPMTSTGPSTSTQAPTVENIYMVGDNPRADVALARNAGRPWWSFLVKTGVFTGCDSRTGRAVENDAMNPADYVVQGVGEAVDTALKL